MPPVHRRTGLTRPAALLTTFLVVAAVLAAPVAMGPSAGAQDIDSLRSRADQLADELHDLEQQASVADEEYLTTLERIDAVRAEMAATEAAVADARSRVEAAEAQASEFLVTSYMEAGSTQVLALANGDDVNQSVNQRVLLDTLRGDRVELADEVAASRRDLEDRNAELGRQDTELASLEDQREQEKVRLEGLVDRQQSLYDDASAELREAVAAEQRRREEEAARAAAARIAQEQAAAQARAAAAAQAQAAAQTQAATRAGGGQRAATPARPAAPAPPRGGGAAPAPVQGPPAPVVAPNSGAAGAIAAAKTQLGRPYRWGGTSPATGFDCSGLMLWSWAQVGVSLPRTSRAQYSATMRVPISQLQPGDLVFTGNPIHHVGMYIGGGQMIHSPHTGDVVKISPIGHMGTMVGGGRIR